MRKAFLGIDVGTSSIKCNLFSPEGRQLLAVAASYPLDRPMPGVIEINEEHLWSSIAASVREVTERSANRYEILGVGLCAMMTMPVLLDARNRPLRPIIHWLDERLMAQSAKLKSQGKDLVINRVSGSLLTGESTVNAISWVQSHEPHVFEKLTKFCMVKDFVRFKLTGNLGTDYGDASGTLMLDTRNWKWSEEVAAELGVPVPALPDLHTATDIAGRVTGEAARATGLAEGTPVAMGSGDGITTILGLGATEEGQVGVTVGSAGVVGVTSTTFPVDELHRNYVFCHPIPDRWYSVMATAASGEVLKWYKQNIVGDPGLTYKDVDEEAGRAPLGSGGVVFLPYILGSRNPHSNPHAVGMFLGLRHKHDRSHMTRALMEGILQEVYDLFVAQREVLLRYGKKITSVKLSGGIVRSQFWTQMLADILGMDIVLAEVEELGTLGGAIMAATAVGYYTGVEQSAANMARDAALVHFDRENHERYEERYRVFRHLYALLEKEFELFGGPEG